jgi:hypothetical protein
VSGALAMWFSAYHLPLPAVMDSWIPTKLPPKTKIQSV